MNIDPLTCPYCNAAFTPPPGATAGQRILCPRCGDAFPLRFLDSITGQPRETPASETGITAQAPASVVPDVSRPSRRSNRLIAGLVLALMLVMAGTGLAFMLMTTSERRAHDTSRPPRRPGRQPGVPEPDVPALVVVPPDKLAALGYVPPRCNVLIGIRIAEMLATPLGRQMLREPLKIGGAEYQLASLPSWVGLRVEDIDHLVFAAQVTEDLVPPYLILRTKQSYNAEELHQRIKGNRVGKKKLIAFHPRQKNLTLHLWCADERTLVLALFPDQLEALPAQPVADLRQIPEEIRTVLKTHREPSATIWFAGHSRDWSNAAAVKFLNLPKNKEWNPFSSVRTFGIWLTADKALEVKGTLECKDAAAAKALEGYFLSRKDEKNATLKTALDGSSLILQYQTDADFLSRLMKR